MSRRSVLRAEGLTKSFGSVTALKNVDLDVYENEMVGLVGDNGAGKSTLIKILSGNFSPDRGTLTLDGKVVAFASPADARAMGIETVYQDLSLCENLNATANLYIGREEYRRVLGLRILSEKKMEAQTRKVLDTIGIALPSIRERVEYLSGGQRQAIALGRFAAWGRKLVLLDEPTAALGVRETKHTLELLVKLRQERRVATVLISHNLQHVFAITDRIVVLRHGQIAGNVKTSETTPDEVVSLITGASLVDRMHSEGGIER